jgi:hypothetical protein
MKNNISQHFSWKTCILLVLVALGLLVASNIYNTASARGILPPEKQTYENRYQQFQHNALAAARPAKNPENRQIIPNEADTTADSSWPTGIFNNGQAPFPSEMYVFENQWQQVVDGNYVNVYAGALGTDPKQGVLVMVTRPDLTSQGNVTVYLTSTKTGSLHITQADNLLLGIVSQNGSTYKFDVATKILSQTK